MVVVVTVCDTIWTKTSEYALRRYRHNQVLMDCKVAAAIRKIILVWVMCKN